MFLKKIQLRRGPGTAGGSGFYRYPVSAGRHSVQLNRYTIPVPNLPPAFEGFRIVHLTDLHYGLFVSYDFLRAVVQLANNIERDMIVCTGDYIHQFNSASQIDGIWPLLASLHAPHGVCSILGNHDHWGDTGRSLYWLERTGQNLRHRSIPITIRGETVWIVGAGDLWEDHLPLDYLMRNIPPEACKIVLAHNPDTADTEFETPVHCLIAGHTHGGQVHLPFNGSPVVLPVKNKNYSFGLKKSRRNFPVFISRGIGWGVVPLRYRCFPEIAVLELTGKVCLESPAASVFRDCVADLSDGADYGIHRDKRSGGIKKIIELSPSHDVFDSNY